MVDISGPWRSSKYTDPSPAQKKWISNGSSTNYTSKVKGSVLLSSLMLKSCNFLSQEQSLFKNEPIIKTT